MCICCITTICITYACFYVAAQMVFYFIFFLFSVVVVVMVLLTASFSYDIYDASMRMLQRTRHDDICSRWQRLCEEPISIIVSCSHAHVVFAWHILFWKQQRHPVSNIQAAAVPQPNFPFIHSYKILNLYMLHG